MASNKDSSSTSKPLDVLIVGGSLGGLMAGILLKRRGHDVRILEQAESSEREGLAAGVGLSFHVKAFFENEDRLNARPLGVANDAFYVLDWNMGVKYKLPLKTNLTTWDSAYYRARANFDGYASSYVPDPPPVKSDGREGEGVFMTGKRVIKVEDVDGKMTAVVQDSQSGETERYQGDILIAADGANSPIRRQLNPGLEREEPGYVIWRGKFMQEFKASFLADALAGTVPENDLSKELLAKIVDKPIIWPGRYTYCVIYTIPGDNGSLKPGERYINFAWYFWPIQFSLKDIMTDSDGHYHRTTIPKGKLRPDIWNAQLEQARRLLNPDLNELVKQIKEPFVSVISSISAPKAAYFDNRLFLVGDALTQSQPNVGMGTSLAAFAVTTLVNEVICPPNETERLSKEKVAEWERKALQETELTRVRSVSFASWYLNSWPMIGYYFARYYFEHYWQRWVGRRTQPFAVFGR